MTTTAQKPVEVHWHSGNNQYFKSIGYGWNRDETKLVQRFFYFGPDEANAKMAAAAKIEEWRQLKRNWPSYLKTLAKLYPGKSLAKPFWPEKMLAPEEEKTVAVEVEESVAPPAMSLEEAKTSFLDAQRARIGLMGKRGLKQSSFNTIAATLDQALKPLTHMSQAPGMSAPISVLTHPMVERVINYHYGHCESERTALNYCRSFKAWLDWMEHQPSLDYVHPKGVAALFKLGTPDPDPFIPTVDQIKTVLQAAENDRCRLYCLLALNCGYTSVDISALKVADITQYKGETYIWRKRDKTSHQNQFSTLHWLFPETAKLLDQHKAPAGSPQGLALLTKDGQPLLQVKEGYRTRSVADMFTTTLNTAKLGESRFTFKSFRKFSATQLLAMTKQDNIARMFLAQKVPGVLRNYVKDDFEQLTVALKAYHVFLREHHVVAAEKSKGHQ